MVDMKFLKTTSTLLNKSEFEQAESLGIDMDISEAKVFAYYDVSKIIAITEHVDNQGTLIPDKCNIIFNTEAIIVGNISPIDCIKVLNGEIVSL